MTHLQHEIEPTGSRQGYVRDVMTPEPVIVSPETSVDEAYRLMQQHGISHLPVCEDGRLIGLVSELDLRLVLPSPASSLAAYELRYLLDRLTVAEIMRHFPVTVGPDHSVSEAARRMLSHQVTALPVTANRRVVGILTRTNFLSAFLRSQATPLLAA